METDDDIIGGRPEGVGAREPARAARRAADRALVARLRVRDEAAYGEFFLQHRGLLLELARREGVRVDRREEVVADFMGRIAMKLARPTSGVPDNLAAYVATSFRHHLIDGARGARSRADATLGALSEHESGEHVVASLSSEHALRESSPRLEDAGPGPELRGLLRHIEEQTTEDERRLLRWLAERVPQRQIAEWIGISHGAARLRASRLRARLRESVLAYAAARPPDERDAVMRLLGRADGVHARAAERHVGRVAERSAGQNEGRERDE